MSLNHYVAICLTEVDSSGTFRRLANVEPGTSDQQMLINIHLNFNVQSVITCMFLHMPIIIYFIFTSDCH
jgi:hypothetical protein